MSGTFAIHVGGVDGDRESGAGEKLRCLVAEIITARVVVNPHSEIDPESDKQLGQIIPVDVLERDVADIVYK